MNTLCTNGSVAKRVQIQLRAPKCVKDNLESDKLYVNMKRRISHRRHYKCFLNILMSYNYAHFDISWRHLQGCLY